ncbi:MAG: hypothetical protein OMM_13184 [Candidatus Magnetoglobus multicellularis str. Araruama]|uniref:Uncharacterized protein n=1 Tax=Candidatus Magnetoglobus multicellularis str. Araruama TaxID=890399 RepID=A0A1V1NUA0_9BACT|nr:MAG: hypothetical protein OMM_13184 [Candidatus Magnetoglobus multicellularis str. Araruama]
MTISPYDGIVPKTEKEEQYQDIAETTGRYTEKAVSEIEKSPISAPGKFVFKALTRGVGGAIRMPLGAMAGYERFIEENRPIKIGGNPLSLLKNVGKGASRMGLQLSEISPVKLIGGFINDKVIKPALGFN